MLVITDMTTWWQQRRGNEFFVCVLLNQQSHRLWDLWVMSSTIYESFYLLIFFLSFGGLLHGPVGSKFPDQGLNLAVAVKAQNPNH